MNFTETSMDTRISCLKMDRILEGRSEKGYREITCFGLKKRQGLEGNRAGQLHQKFQGVPLPPEHE